MKISCSVIIHKPNTLIKRQVSSPRHYLDTKTFFWIISLFSFNNTKKKNMQEFCMCPSVLEML